MDRLKLINCPAFRFGQTAENFCRNIKTTTYENETNIPDFIFNEPCFYIL